MKVIGAGFGRTGTLSLKYALEELGFGPCYHMHEVFSHPDHAQVWTDAWEGKAVTWQSFLGAWGATVDWPACTFYKQLMEAFPEGKVLLSVRDEEKWYESALETIYKIGNTLPMSLVGPLIPRLGGPFRMIRAVIWRGTFQGHFRDRSYALEVYRRHIEEVKRYVPPERLLVYEVKEGWEPLCRFLEVPVPATPFPRRNDTAEFQQNIRRARIGATAVTTLLVGLAVAMGMVIWRWLGD